MPFSIVNQDTILSQALALARSARRRIWITSPWITARAVNLLLQDVLPRARDGDLDIRIVYRVKEPGDLEITDLGALQLLEDAGCRVRYSTRLHAKLVLVDDRAAIVSSSNLTATAGYGTEAQAAGRNEELGVVVDTEPTALADLERQFLTIWEAATCVDENTVGIAMDFPQVGGYSFVAIREVRLGEYATARDASGNPVVGRIAQVTAYNRSFPRMNQSMWITQGYAPPGDQGGAVEIPDLQSLFSHPSKEHGFLVAKTFFDPASVFCIAKVEVLRHLRDGRLAAPSVPVVPGSDVTRASPELLRLLLGEGDVPIGSVLHHPEVEVRLRGAEVLSKHLAVLGMTGSGKSNALKVFIRSLLTTPGYEDVRVAIVDSHGEYARSAPTLSPHPVVVDVELRHCILDAEVVKELLRLGRRDEKLVQTLGEIAEGLPPTASLDDFLAAVEDAAADAERTLGGKLRRLAEVARQRRDLCLWPEEGARLVRPSGEPAELTAPGLYVLDLRATADLEARSAKVAHVVRHLFQQGKDTEGRRPALVVVDEAQNYAPEQQTGLLSRTRRSFEALFTVASEGRKFNVGLVVATQRPARLNKDVLSQCNTHMIFRVANVEDLQAIAGSFEAASQPLLDELPGFENGVCVVGGTALGMVTRVSLPLFDAGDARAPEGCRVRPS